MAKDSFNELRQSLAIVRGVASSLYSLSESFEKTGNERLSDKLYLLGEILDNQANTIKKIDSDRVQAQFDESWKSTGETLALIAGKMGNGLS